jgi:hypothetical protein
MASVRTVTNVAAGDDGTATWADQVYDDIGNLFDDKTMNAASDGATVTFDMNTSCIHTVTLGGNRILAVTNDIDNRLFMIRLVQDGAGGRTVTWWSGIKWPGGTPPALSSDPGAIDTFIFLRSGSGAYDGYFGGFRLTT